MDGIRAPTAPVGSRTTQTAHVGDAVVFVVSLGMFVLSALLDVGNDYVGWTVLTLTLLLGFHDAGRSSLGTVILFTGVTLFAIPYLSLIYVDAQVQVAWFAGFIIVAKAMFLFGDSNRAAAMPAPSSLNLPIIAVALVAGLLFWSDQGLLQISFYAGWAIAMVHLDRLHASTISAVWRLAGVGLFVLSIGGYMLFFWGGYGRIIFISFMLAPLLLTVRYGTVRFNVFLFVGVIALLPFVGRVLRFGWSDGLAGLSEDSGASPITLTSTLWINSSSVINPGSILEQWTLLFLGWVPREIWAGKPLGINSSFVDLFLGRQGVSMEHSTAIGYFGEHLFYLPTFWWVSAALLTAVIIVLRRLLARYCAPFISPVIVLDVWLITLFWGGMASFAARAWFALLPMLAYVVVLKRLTTASNRAAATALAAR
jgi:hypothetical protein